MTDKSSNLVYCDGGLSNRLNALIFALILGQRFGQTWTIAWPRTNWCEADLADLFVAPLPVVTSSLPQFLPQQDRFRFVMHENQCQFDESRVTYQRNVAGFDGYAALLEGPLPLFYYNNLIPDCAGIDDMRAALARLPPEPGIVERARQFCAAHAIDSEVAGLHIRKTDFGDAVNDSELYRIASTSPRRFFVCSDDREVNERFAALPNCSVFPKSHFPEKRAVKGGWTTPTVDSEGRVFSYNITRGGESIVEALIDLLILSVTTPVATSGSTFLRMSTIFKSTGYFSVH